MPNLDTHAGLAMNHNPEGGIEFAAGEVFDDAVRMAGGLPIAPHPEALFALGIRSNNSITDPAFDGQPALIEAQRAMAKDLEAADMPRSLHRLCTGPGTDILFSGVSLQRPESATYLEVCEFLLSDRGRDLIADHAGVGRNAVVSVEQVQTNVLAIARAGLQTGYSDPAYVVERLRKRVANRPRLAFPSSFVRLTELSAIFAAQQSRLAASANEIYCGTVDAIISSSPPSSTTLAQAMLPIVPGIMTMVERVGKPTIHRLVSDWENILQKELAAFSGTTEAGRQKFIAARSAAHFLLQHGARHPDDVIISRQGGGPRFPADLVGSLTHSGDFAAVSIASRDTYRSIGIDLETNFGEKGRLRVISTKEDRMPHIDGISTRTLFSIKEAVFKAIHPLVEHEHPRKFWFHDAEIDNIVPLQSTASIRLSDTERGKIVGRILGTKDITCHYLQTGSFSSAVCTVS